MEGNTEKLTLREKPVYFSKYWFLEKVLCLGESEKMVENGLSIKVFGVIKPNQIVVPQIPFTLRNNCQIGRWTQENEECCSRLAFSILGFKRFFGSLGLTVNTLWGQIWFLPEASDAPENKLPRNIVMVTYIKGASLTSFNRLVTKIIALGVDPAVGIFEPVFCRKVKQKIDENGVIQTLNYYSLDWRWYHSVSDAPPLKSEFEHEINKAIKNRQQRLAVISQILETPELVARMEDLENTKNMVPVENLPETETNALMTRSVTDCELLQVEDKIVDTSR